MLRRWLLTVCFPVGFVAGAQAMAVTLSGNVTNPNGVGVAGVVVDLYDPVTGDKIPIQKNTTDSLGNYNLNNPIGVPAATYNVAFKPLLASGVVPVIIRNYALSGNQVLNDTLPFGFVLSSFVRDTAGVGLPDIDLKVTSDSTGAAVYTPGATDPNGFYATRIPAGVFTLVYRPIAGQKLASVQYKGTVSHVDTTRNVTLRAGFFASGTVLDNLSTPVGGANIKFHVSATQELVSTLNHTTDIAGHYQVTVAPGTYDISVEPLLANKIVGGKKFAVTITRDTTINFTLPHGQYLSGFARRANNLAVVPNVSIDVRDTLTSAKLVTPFDITDSTGFYKIVVPAGTFNVDFLPPLATGLASVESARVAVAADRALNATLPAGVTLSGSLQRTGGGGLFNVEVKFHNPSTDAKIPLANNFTDALGNYAVAAVPGTYNVEFNPPKAARRVAQEFLNFALNANTTLNVTLDSGRSISGVVKDSLNNPLRDVDFNAFTLPARSKVFTPSDNTDSTGFYQVIVPAANLDLAYTPPLLSRFAGVMFAGLPITKDTTINLILRHGVELSGTVRDSAGARVAGVEVHAFGSPETPLANGATDSAGFFAGILVPGTYSLLFVPPPASGLDSLRLTNVVVQRDTTIGVTLLHPGAQTCCLITPNAIDFGQVPVGQSKDTTFTVANCGTTTQTGTISENCVEVSLIAGGGAYSLASGQSRTVTVRYAPLPNSPGVLTCAVRTGNLACPVVNLTGAIAGCVLRGDVTNDAVADITDIVALIQNVVFDIGLPNPQAGDTNCDSVRDISDIVLLIQYVVFGNPTPCCL